MAAVYSAAVVEAGMSRAIDKLTKAVVEVKAVGCNTPEKAGAAH